MYSLYLFAVSILFATARAQQSAYGQCGGINWTGPTTCVAGYHCLVQNPYYYQCVQGVAATTLTTSTTPKCTGKKATRSVAAEQSAYGQCGGINWSGVTTCVTGYYCLVQNPYYFQCVPGAPASTSKSSTKTKCTGKKTTTTTPSVSIRDVQCTPITVLRSTTTQAPNAQRALTTTASQCSWKTVTKNTAKTSSTTTSAAAASSQSSSSFKWFGVNVAGAEFGTAKPGVYNTDYTFASTASLDTLMAEGYNIFRFPFMMERMAPTTMSSPLAAYYLGNYSLAINHVTQKGGYAIVDPHNFGRYYDAIITDIAALKTFWSNLAAAFKDNSRVVFDTNNEYHDMDISLVFNLNQAAIDGIRGAGATSQYIFAEGNSYSAAWFWATASDMLKDLKDPQNKLIYEMHLYLDSDNSGTSSTCALSTVGVDRITAATAWLKANNKVGILGEFAGGNNDLCMTAVKGLVNHLKDNKDVWTGALWWAAGPWWGDYLYGFEPPSGVGYTYYDPTLKAFAPGISA